MRYALIFDAKPESRAIEGWLRFPLLACTQPAKTRNFLDTRINFFCCFFGFSLRITKHTHFWLHIHSQDHRNHKMWLVKLIKHVQNNQETRAIRAVWRVMCILSSLKVKFLSGHPGWPGYLQSNPGRPPPDPKFIISMVLVEYEGIRVYHQN